MSGLNRTNTDGSLWCPRPSSGGSRMSHCSAPALLQWAGPVQSLGGGLASALHQEELLVGVGWRGGGISRLRLGKALAGFKVCGRWTLRSSFTTCFNRSLWPYIASGPAHAPLRAWPLYPFNTFSRGSAPTAWFLCKRKARPGFAGLWLSGLRGPGTIGPFC